jgi:hypothetical protein
MPRMRKALIALTLVATAGATTYAVWVAPQKTSVRDVAAQAAPLNLAPSTMAETVREDWPDGAETPKIIPVIVNEPRPAFSPVVRTNPVEVAPDDNRRGQRVLAMALQGELRRVGCYRGVIDGAWLGASQVAMKRFLSQKNAQLPVDQPDQALLSLLQSAENNFCKKKVKTPDFVTVVRPALRGYGDDSTITGRGLDIPRPTTVTRRSALTDASVVADGVSDLDALPEPMTVGRTEPVKPRKRYRSRDRSVETLFKHPLGGGF